MTDEERDRLFDLLAHWTVVEMKLQNGWGPPPEDILLSYADWTTTVLCGVLIEQGEFRSNMRSAMERWRLENAEEPVH